MIDTPSHNRRVVINRSESFQLAAQVMVCLVIVAITWALRPVLGHADDRFWNSITGGAFGNQGNWNPASVPGSGDVAIFNLSNLYTVTFGFSPTNQRLLVRGGTVTFDLDGQTYTLTQTGVTNPSIVVGNSSGDVADLRIVNGTLSGQTAMIGHQAGSQGTARVTGVNAVWNNAEVLHVGAFGQGSLIVTSGGSVTSLSGNIGTADGSTGTATISGSGSLWTGMNQLAVGSSGQGTLNIQSGGLVSNTTGYIGRFSTGSGAATVTGMDSTWDNSGSLYVGGSAINAGGSGTLTVANGGRVNVGGTLRVWGGTGTLTVNGGLVEATNIVIDPTATLNWDNQGTLRVKGGSISGLHDAGNNIFIGSNGGRILELVGGATLTGQDAFIGDLAGESGSVRLHGAGSQWNMSSQMIVGGQGQGQLSIEAGAQVSNTGGVIGGANGAIGVVQVTGPGSQWINSHDLYVGQSGQGTMHVTGGGFVSNTFGLIGQYSTSTGEVIVSGAGSHWQNTNDLYVGNEGQGSLLVESGGLVTSSSSIIGIGAPGSGAVTVTGNGSQWTNSGILQIGYQGPGTLNIESGGKYVSSGETYLGWEQISTGSLTITGAGSEWSSQQLIVGTGGQGELVISNGGQATSALGAVGYWEGSSGLAIVTGANSQWNVEDFNIGAWGNGTMIIEGGGKATSYRSDIGNSNGVNGQVVVNGSGSQWVTSGDLRVGVNGSGAIHVGNGGTVNSFSAFIGMNSGSNGSVTVDGAGSSFGVTSALWVGEAGSGELNILNGGTVSSSAGYVGTIGSGTVAVSGSGARWNLSDQLELGGSGGFPGGEATLAIGPGGTVDVGGLMRLYDAATLNLHGGTLRLNDNQFIHTPASTINYLSGTLQLAGSRTIGTDAATTAFFGTSPNIGTGKHLRVEGTANLLAPVTLTGGTFSVGNLQNASLLNFQNGTFNLTGSSLNIGSGGMFGDVLEVNSQQTYNISQTATVYADGALFVNNGGRFQSQILTNYGDVILGGNNARITATAEEAFRNYGLVSGAGRIEGEFSNRAGGIVELEAGKRLTFTNYFTNQSGARLIGRGQLAAPGIANYGEMLFSGGFTDIQAPITGWSDSQMIITGGGTTSVFGDVEIKGGAELRISDFSNGVFFDHVQLRNGALLTGGGNAFFEGSLGIGDSPSRQEFNFNVTLGPTSNLLVEIAGVDPILPEFDQYIFHKNLTLQGGSLTLDLIGLNPGDLAYQPQLGDSFNVFEVHGQWTGQFGSYQLPVLNGRLEWNLSQLYSHGTIFVSQVIPEPGSATILLLTLAGLLSIRNRPTARNASCL